MPESAGVRPYTPPLSPPPQHTLCLRSTLLPAPFGVAACVKVGFALAHLRLGESLPPAPPAPSSPFPYLLSFPSCPTLISPLSLFSLLFSSLLIPPLSLPYRLCSTVKACSHKVPAINFGVFLLPPQLLSVKKRTRTFFPEAHTYTSCPPVRESRKRRRSSFPSPKTMMVRRRKSECASFMPIERWQCASIADPAAPSSYLLTPALGTSLLVMSKASARKMRTTRRLLS